MDDYTTEPTSSGPHLPCLSVSNTDPSCGCSRIIGLEIGKKMGVDLTAAQWRDIALKKQTHRENVLSKYADWRIKVPQGTTDVSQLVSAKLTNKERNIIHCDATALVDLIRKKIYTAVEVLTAFAKVAVVAQDATNCLSEIFIDDALMRARALDKHLEETGETVGPLHGLPVSIKDHIKVKGLDTSSGYIGLCIMLHIQGDSILCAIASVGVQNCG
jgi:amidase